ncbi:MAG: AAA family ATPase [Halobacteria archaeon]
MWLSRHAPESVDDAPQEKLHEPLRMVVEEDLNAVFYGPEGSGKSAMARAVCIDRFGDASNLFVLNAKDFFGMTKKEISEDPRFRHFITSKRRRKSSKADMINHVLKEVASHPSVGDRHKILLIDDAGGMRRDFQQALRRVMERYSGTCQFILTADSLGSLIPAIQSRCFPVPFEAPAQEGVVDVLDGIADEEDLTYDDEGLEYVAEDADGNLRDAVSLLQTVAETRGEVNIETVFDVTEEVETSRAYEMLKTAREGSFDDARDILDDLLIDEGYTGKEILREILQKTNELNDSDASEIACICGEVDHALAEGNNDRIHLEKLIASV